LGAGFVQWDPFLTSAKGRYEITSISTGGHMGYLDIMLYMGILGLSCFAWFILAMLKRLVYIFKYTQDELYKATIMGFMGFLILCVVASLAHGPLTSIIGIVPISIFMGLTEAILTVEQKLE
jgi:O-antigen ligase